MLAGGWKLGTTATVNKLKPENWLPQLSLVVVREAGAMSPNQLCLYGGHAIGRHGSDEDQVAGAVHCSVDRVARASAIA